MMLNASDPTKKKTKRLWTILYGRVFFNLPICQYSKMTD